MPANRSIELARELESAWGVAGSRKLVAEWGEVKARRVHERLCELQQRGRLAAVKSLSSYYVQCLRNEPDTEKGQSNTRSDDRSDEFIERYLAKQRSRGLNN